ncbi:hypothetical protein H4R26_001818 [Coemansia thaxteri]|uniref:UBA domain-containing protein n=1 Tax=Coemansia thaxteri TaxID=2663907 RepID=A0A9W8BHS7_9FUNG|nr:hypothetical protein H4R26_001818 [Coemansia thaxteri]KAJ2485559.1 hypothetical protein EV174_001649 [Coemansia sp. RSA 2320]
MSEHVQGVKLRFELPFKLPVPVSFPFESIGDFRSINHIPKYDFSLEKKIMKEIAKQKQEDQFNMLRQAQQQLSMVDLIASRKNRHKGKEPERSADGKARTDAGSSLIKPQSDSGVSRLQSTAAATGSYGLAEAAKHEQGAALAQPQQQAKVQESSNPPIHFGSTVSPVGMAAAIQSSQVERPHSAEPAVTITQPAPAIRPAQPTVSQQMYPPSSNPLASSAASMAGLLPAYHQQVSANIQPSPNQQSLQSSRPAAYMSMAPAGSPMYQSPMFSSRYSSQQPSAGQQAPHNFMSSPGGFGARPGPGNMGVQAFQQQLRPQSQPRPQYQVHLPPQQQQQPQPPLSQQQYNQSSSQQINLTIPNPRPNRLSTSFGPGPSWAQEAPASQNDAASRPALPPKPDEWKPAPFTVSGTMPSATGDSTQHSSDSAYGPLPLPPRRPPNQSDPAPPAIPPKPFTTFNEFDYAPDDPSGLNPVGQSGHVEQLNTLVNMGFSRPQAIQALEMYDYDVNKASNYLIDKAF